MEENNLPEESNSEFDEDASQKISEENKLVQPKRLFRSRTNKIIFGVCGGLADYFNLDPIIFQLFFILSLILGGWGIVIYFILSIVLQTAPYSNYQTNDLTASVNVENVKILFSAFLILLGTYLLLLHFGLSNHFSFFGIRQQVIVPAFLVVVVIILSLRFDFSFSEVIQPSGLFRSSQNKMIAGVCLGFAEYINVPVLSVRIYWVALSVLTLGVGVIIYLLMVFVVPIKNGSNNAE
ncbi:MAG: PspC domain-containing protein [Ignavibacteriales bacterium]|nr:PspC domain-containing protein [Ignavibacteriales bacterium]